MVARLTAWFPPPADAVSRRVTVDGIAMHVVEAGQGPPVLLIHGLGWDGSMWSPTVDLIAGDHHVVTADTRGHGASDAPPGPYTIAGFARDYAALLDALRLEQVVVVGLSQGGMVAQTLALTRPDLVAALVLVSTASRSDPAAREHMEARLSATERDGAAAAARLAVESIFSPSWRAANPSAVERFVAWRTAMPLGPLAAATRAAYGFDLTGDLSCIAVPTLVVAGGADRLTPPSGMEDIAARIPGARYVVVPDAGHILPVERPDAFHGHLLSFLAALATSGTPVWPATG